MKKKLAESYFRAILKESLSAYEKYKSEKSEFYFRLSLEEKSKAYWILATIEAYEGTRKDLREEYTKLNGKLNAL